MYKLDACTFVGGVPERRRPGVGQGEALAAAHAA